MRFKTTPPTLHEAILMESVGHAIKSGSPDYISIMHFIISRADEHIAPDQLLDRPLDEIVDLFCQAMTFINPNKATPPPAVNSVDQVALTPDEKERLQNIMQQMRERNS